MNYTKDEIHAARVVSKWTNDFKPSDFEVLQALHAAAPKPLEEWNGRFDRVFTDIPKSMSVGYLEVLEGLEYEGENENNELTVFTEHVNDFLFVEIVNGGGTDHKWEFNLRVIRPERVSKHDIMDVMDWYEVDEVKEFEKQVIPEELRELLPHFSWEGINEGVPLEGRKVFIGKIRDFALLRILTLEKHFVFVTDLETGEAIEVINILEKSNNS